MPLVNSSLPGPWADFLREVDRLLPNPVELQCLGGFVLVTRYGFPRATNDIDYLPTLPPDEQHRLLEIAGMGSSLHKRFHVYIQCVGGVTSLAENYEARLEDTFPGQFEKLRILALDPYDLVLSKLERNSPKDREDVKYLARIVSLSADKLLARYRKELRPYLSNEARHDLTIDLWVEDYFPS
jgi:hypothetical protein